MSLLKPNVPVTCVRDRYGSCLLKCNVWFLNLCDNKATPYKKKNLGKSWGETTQAFPVLAAGFGVLVTTFPNSESCNAGCRLRVFLLSLHGEQGKGRTEQGDDEPLL